MGKKSREKKLRHDARKRSASGLDLSTFHHPFAGIPIDALTRGLTEVGRKQAQEFIATTAKIQDLISGTNPLCLLASLAAYGLTVGIRDDGSITPANKQGILPAHVELAQALCLRTSVEKHSNIPALSKNVQTICDALAEWSDQFHWKRLVQLETATNETERKSLKVLEHIRLSTQVVRNWGYYDQVKRISMEIMTPLDARFAAIHGFRATDVIAIFDHLFREWEVRINEHLHRLHGMMTAETLRGTIVAYYTAFPDLTNTAVEFEKEMRKRHASLKALKFMLLSHADLRLPQIATFTADDISIAIGRPPDVVTKALDKLSLRFGDLADENVEHFFMSNPVWTRPAIRLGGGAYFCVMPQSFFAFLFETLLTLIRDDEALRVSYDDRRSVYLEETTATLFANAFPGSKITPNFKWHTADRTQQFESDLIVHVDSFLILVEAKSGRVSSEARRGAQKSLRENIDALLIEPSRQSQRLEEAIVAAKRGDAGTAAFSRGFPADLSTIHRVLRLSVSLEDIGFLQTNVNELKEVSYVPTDLHVAPAVTLADLEIVFDILSSPYERLHYWVRRGEWEQRAYYMADEIDLLGTYLKTGLNLGDLEFNKTHLMLVGESKAIDDYYEALREGITTEKPKSRATDWWRDILLRLQAKKPHRWLEAAVVLLCAGFDQQVEFERRTKTLIADVRKRRERAASRNGLIFIPATSRAERIAVLALMGIQMADRHRLMENLAAQVFEESADVDQCVAIALNIDDLTYPYGSLAWFGRPAGEASG